MGPCRDQQGPLEVWLLQVLPASQPKPHLSRWIPGVRASCPGAATGRVLGPGSALAGSRIQDLN
jgi:hypothetical protein